MNPERRHELLAKFPVISNQNPMPPRTNTQVRATDRADEIIALAWGDDPAAVLCDPAAVSGLAERADEAAAEFHRREGEASRERALGLRPSLHYNTFDTPEFEFDPDAPAEQGAVRIWHVGANHVTIVRERWRDQRLRDIRDAPAAEVAGDLRHTREMLDGWNCVEFGCPGECDLLCSVRLAKACGGTTRLLPVNRGTLILLFRVCDACEALAGQIAANNYKTCVIVARADLPRGAVILPPGGTLPPTPEAP